MLSNLHVNVGEGTGLSEVVVILNNRNFRSFHRAFLLWSKAFCMILIFCDKWEISEQQILETDFLLAFLHGYLAQLSTINSGGFFLGVKEMSVPPT